MKILLKSVAAICAIAILVILMVKIFDMKFDLLSYWCGMFALTLSQIIIGEK